MNKISILFTLILIACQNKYEESKTLFNPPSVTPDTDILAISTENSNINWQVSEMMGLKHRKGKVKFKSGYLLKKGNLLVGGNFIVDMKTISPADVPVHEKIARRNLINHLESSDFFDVKEYPEAKLEIIGISENKARAALTIKGKNREVTFDFKRNKNGYQTSFSFDRYLWGVNYKGSFADKTLIDNLINIEVNVIAENN